MKEALDTAKIELRGVIEDYLRTKGWGDISIEQTEDISYAMRETELGFYLVLPHALLRKAS